MFSCNSARLIAYLKKGIETCTFVHFVKILYLFLSDTHCSLLTWSSLPKLPTQHQAGHTAYCLSKVAGDFSCMTDTQNSTYTIHVKHMHLYPDGKGGGAYYPDALNKQETLSGCGLLAHLVHRHIDVYVYVYQGVALAN